ncbi:hypothetical protein HAALTHF_27620n [Vreelandella aquamarina]|nr:hypothetical protein HAALTHF_27620n [Halomonas axialensis]
MRLDHSTLAPLLCWPLAALGTIICAPSQQICWSRFYHNLTDFHGAIRIHHESGWQSSAAQKQILKDISLSFFPGAKIGVLGLNGAGKSTLLRIMAGVDKEFEGEARPMPGINVGYLPQEPQLDDEKNVRETVEEALGAIKEAQEKLDAVYAAYAEPDADFDALASEQARLENIIEAADAHNLERKLEVAAEALRLPPWDAKVGNLSGGERRRVALCRLLLSSPDMLLLDEPTNHLDAESVAWLERFLHDYNGTVVAITHDRYFLDNVAGWILELDRGQGIPFEGNYSQWLEQKEQRLTQEAKQEASRQKAIKQELEWVRSNAKGRQAKSKARLNRFEEMQSGDFQKRNETNEIYIPPGPRLGDKVIEFHNVTKRFDEKTALPGSLLYYSPQGRLWVLWAVMVPVNRRCLSWSPAKSSRILAKC